MNENEVTGTNALPEERKVKITMSALELLHSDIPKPEWLVEGLVPKSNITFIAGAPGSTKSFLALLTSLCIASGTNLFGEITCKQGIVLYVDEENGKEEIKRRLELLKNAYGFSDQALENIHFMFYQGFRVDKRWTKHIIEAIPEKTPDLIVIDSLVRVLEGDENSAEDARKLFNSFRPLMRDHGTTILVLAHCRKTNRNTSLDLNSIRGSSDFVACASSVLLLDPQGKNTFCLTQVKNRSKAEEASDLVIKIVDKESDEGIKGVFFEVKQGTAGKRLPAAELAAEDIIKWLDETKKQEFKTKEVLEKLADKHKDNAVYSALRILNKRGELKHKSHGTWSVV